MGSLVESIKSSTKVIKIGLATAVRLSISQKAAEKYLLNSLVGIPGISQKIAQWLNIKSGTQAATCVDRLSLTEVKTILQFRSPGLYDEIGHISQKGISASLGQVHKVTLKNNCELAVKVQYPEIQSLFKRQLRLLGFALGKSPAVKFGLDVQQYQEGFLNKIEDELDYLKEAKNQNLFYKSFKDELDVAIPVVYTKYSSQTVLVQEWMPAIQISELTQLSKSEKFQIGQKIFRNLVVSIFKKGLVHTDFQPENWGYDKQTKRIVIYDFGSTLELNLSQRRALMHLVLSAMSHDNKGIFDALLALGFKSENLLKIADKIPFLIESMLEPLISSKPWKVREWQLTISLQRTLGDLTWWFRASGPPWFLLLMRAVQGYVFALKSLEVVLPSAEIFSQVVSETPNLNKEVNIPKQINFHKKVNELYMQYPNCAQWLKVLIQEGGKDKVTLSMPRRSVDDMEELIDVDVLQKLKSQGLSLSDSIEKIQKSGYVPQLIFEERTSAGKLFKVWLE